MYYALLLRRLFTSLAMASRLRFQRDLCVMADNKYVWKRRRVNINIREFQVAGFISLIFVEIRRECSFSFSAHNQSAFRRLLASRSRSYMYIAIRIKYDSYRRNDRGTIMEFVTV